MRFIFLSPFIFLYGSVIGQDSTKPIAAFPRVNLFCMLNQSIYLSGDTILFAGWILNRNRAIMEDQNTLYVVLTDPIEGKVIAHNRWVIQNGLGGGRLPIPDTLDNGYYWFMAYTNYMIEYGHQPVFKQLLDIKAPWPKPFTIVWDSTEEKVDTIFVNYKIGTRYKGVAAGGTMTYHVWQMADSLASGTLSIDAFGEVMIPISRKRLVMDYELYNEIQVAFTVTRGTDHGRFILPLRWKPKYGIPVDSTQSRQ